MFNNAFIQLTSTAPTMDGKCELAVPVSKDDTVFHFQTQLQTIKSVAIRQNGQIALFNICDTTKKGLTDSVYVGKFNSNINGLEDGACFRLMLSGNPSSKSLSFDYEDSITARGDELIVRDQSIAEAPGVYLIQFNENMVVQFRKYRPGRGWDPWSDYEGSDLYFNVFAVDAQGRRKQIARIPYPCDEYTFYVPDAATYIDFTAYLDAPLRSATELKIETLVDEEDCRPEVTGYLYEGALFSNMLKLAKDKEGLSTLKYRCNEAAFDFPNNAFIANSEPCMLLPIRMHSPQNVQDDKTYVKANGEVVTLYAKYYKEWECETEYIPAEWHDKMVAALCCDEVYIDGKRVTKSDKYQVDWEKYDTFCDGETKLAKATFKVRENITQRNSNF